MNDFNWRYDVVTDANGNSTIYRGRPYKTDDYDHWNDGEVATYYVGFYTGNYRNPAHILSDSRWNENAEDSERLMAAHKAALNYPQPGDRVGSAQSPITRWWGNDPVTRAARRMGLAGVVHVTPWPGDEYIIGYWAAPDATEDERREAGRETADAVEAYMTGDVWRIEIQSWVPRFGHEDDYWQVEDEAGEDWIGSQIEAEFESQFSLAEFPAELLVEDRAS